MKTSKTMRELAKALALEQGLRVPKEGRGYVGYALSIDAIKLLYMREGFPVTTKKGIATMDNHIKMWIESHMAERSGDLIFFALDEGSFWDFDATNTLTKYMSENANPNIVNVSEVLNSIGWVA